MTRRDLAAQAVLIGVMAACWGALAVAGYWLLLAVSVGAGALGVALVAVVSRAVSR